MKLTQGYTTEIDDILPEKIAWIVNVRWYAHKSRNSIYARRITSKNGKRVSQFLHRIIANTPRYLQTDHDDGDTLNNKMDNLKNVTQSTNIKKCWRKKKCNQQKRA